MTPSLERSLSHQAPKPGTDQVARIEALRSAAKVLGQAIEDHGGAGSSSRRSASARSRSPAGSASRSS